MGTKMTGNLPPAELEADMATLNDEKYRDSRLTSNGIQQAEARWDEAKVSKKFAGLELVVSSPLSRCLHTATIVFRDTLLDPAVSAEASEHFREFISSVPSESPRPPASLEAEYPRFSFPSSSWQSSNDVWATNNTEYSVPGDAFSGFKAREVASRAGVALRWLMDRYIYDRMYLPQCV
jgi:hypothetical protein